MVKRGRPAKARRGQADELSTAGLLPAPSPNVLSPVQIRRYSARLSQRDPTHGPLRLPVRNFPQAKKLNLDHSSASSPLKKVDDFVEDFNDEEKEPVSHPDPNPNPPVAPQPPPPRSTAERSALTLEYTQIGEREVNYGADDDEIESADPEPALVNVGRYRVKVEIAADLRDIIRKYGDIGECSILKNKKSIVLQFEKICSVVNELKLKNSKNFPPVEREKLMDELLVAESVKIRVDWLQNRLNEIEDAFQYGKDYVALKEKYTENLTVIVNLETEMETRKKEMEKELEKMKEELEKRKEEQKILCKNLVDRKMKMEKTLA